MSGQEDNIEEIASSSGRLASVGGQGPAGELISGSIRGGRVGERVNVNGGREPSKPLGTERISVLDASCEDPTIGGETGAGVTAGGETDVGVVAGETGAGVVTGGDKTGVGSTTVTGGATGGGLEWVVPLPEATGTVCNIFRLIQTMRWPCHTLTRVSWDMGLNGVILTFALCKGQLIVGV